MDDQQRRAWERERKRQYRARKRAETGAVVTDIGLVPRGQSGTSRVVSVTDAVLGEVESLPMASKRPADVATALAMARILDDPQSIPQQAQAAARLREILKDLRQEVEGGKSKLATLRAIRAEG